MKFVCADLPRPNSTEEDGYGSGGVEAVKLFLTGDDEVAAALGFEKLELEREVERSKRSEEGAEGYL